MIENKCAAPCSHCAHSESAGLRAKWKGNPSSPLLLLGKFGSRVERFTDKNSVLFNLS